MAEGYNAKCAIVDCLVGRLYVVVQHRHHLYQKTSSMHVVSYLLRLA